MFKTTIPKGKLLAWEKAYFEKNRKNLIKNKDVVYMTIATSETRIEELMKELKTEVNWSKKLENYLLQKFKSASLGGYMMSEYGLFAKKQPLKFREGVEKFYIYKVSFLYR